MKVTITTDGVYSDFHGQFAGATERKKGDLVEYPDWYAEMLIASTMAVVPVEVVIEPEVVPASKRTYTRKARKPRAK